MAKNCVLAMGQHRGQPKSLSGQSLVRDRVYRAVDRMQSARPKSDLYRAPTETQGHELSPGHDAMLRRSESCQLTLASMAGGQLAARVNFCPHIGGQVHSRLRSAPLRSDPEQASRPASASPSRLVSEKAVGRGARGVARLD